MKVHDVEQGSADWYKVRLGLPTASAFGSVLTTKGVDSQSLSGYAAQLAAEKFAGKPLDAFESAATKRGHEQEAAARDLYAFTRGVSVTQVGFVTDDLNRYGCSPDGLVGDDGMVECKSRLARLQAQTIAKGTPPAANLMQMQGQLMICEREWCDYVSYHPDLPLFIHRVFADKSIHQLLAIAINKTILKRDVYFNVLKKYGAKT